MDLYCFEVMILANVFILIHNRKPRIGEPCSVLPGAQGNGFQPCHDIAPCARPGRRGKEQATVRLKDLGASLEQELLVVRFEEENETDG